MTVQPCPFCTLPPERVIHRNRSGVVIRDGFPVSAGHTLIIPHRHIGSFFGLTTLERDDLLALPDWAKQQLSEQLAPDGWNIGINDGTAAEHTVQF